MSGVNMKIDKFKGRNSFSLWQIKMRALLKQQGMWAPLTKKSMGPETAEMTILEEKAHSTIMLCLADDIITEVAEEETASGLWLKLESLYMTKSLTNKLLLKQRLFSLRMNEVRIGLLYVIAGLGGSLMSGLFVRSNISVGASGAVFGLLGAMLSELIINWTIYSNKVASLVMLVLIVAINLAVGILPHVDNFAHIGGFLSGFFLGFVFLIRPQFGWVSQKYISPGDSLESRRPKYKIYQGTLWIISLIVLIIGFIVAFVMLFRGIDGNDHCSWCHYLSCVPTSKWSCNSEPGSCVQSQLGNQMNLTCVTTGNSRTYNLSNISDSQLNGLCTQLCSNFR